jgi:hypothetical protein
MTEGQNKDAGKDEGCCSSSSGCCGKNKKFLAGLLLGVVLAGGGFGLFMAGKCSGKMCKMKGDAPAQTAPQAPMPEAAK